MKVNLLRNNRPLTEWISVGQMLDDLTEGLVVLEPGDKMFVVESDGPHLSIVREPRALNLVQSDDHH